MQVFPDTFSARYCGKRAERESLPPMIHFPNAVFEVLKSLGPADYIALVVVASVICQWIAWKVRVPSLLLLLLFGFGLGQAVTAEQVFGREVMFGGVSVAVGIILFEGSLSLRFRQIRDLGRPILRLCFVTTAIAWPLITLAAWLIGFDIRVALLVGAILIVTGPTVINPILRTLRPTRRVSSLLRWEGIVVDPIGAILAVLVFQGIRAGSFDTALPSIAVTLVKILLISFGIAIVLGATMTALMRRHAIPDFLHGVAFLGVAIGAMQVSNAVESESGLLTITLLGIYLANQRDIHLEHVLEFKEHLQVLLVGTLFVVLAGRVTPGQLGDVAPRALVFFLLLVIVVRPVSIWLGLWGTKVQRRERTLLSCMAPRGIVAASVTSIFALEFARAAAQISDQAAKATGTDAANLAHEADRLNQLATQANDMVPLVFLLIVGTVATYGLGVGHLAERLGLAASSPQGVLFAGMNPLIADICRLLAELNVPTLVVDRDYRPLARAHMAGLNAENVNILSEYAVQEMDLSGLGYLVACTHDDDTNATAARQFGPIFGRANVYQLHRGDETDSPAAARRNPAGHLSGRFPFAPALSYDELRGRLESGMTVKCTALSQEFSLTDFRARYGADTVVMFVHQDGKLDVVREDTKLPERHGSLIALVHDNA